MNRGSERRRLSPLFTWRSAVLDSDLPATARHVALTLSCHMSEVGDSAFPSLETLAQESGRGKSTVSDALKELENRGYLTVVRKNPDDGGRGRGGRGQVNNYRAQVPERSDPRPIEAPEGSGGGPLQTVGAGTVGEKGSWDRNRNGPESSEKRSADRTGERTESVIESVLRRCPVFDGLVDEMQRQPSTKSERDKWNGCEKEIREALAREWAVPIPQMLDTGTDGDQLYARIRLEIRRRARRYRQSYEHARLTPRALVMHWGELGDPVPAPSLEDHHPVIPTAEPELSPEDQVRAVIARARITGHHPSMANRPRSWWTPIVCPDCGDTLRTFQEAAQHPEHDVPEVAIG